MMPRRKLFARPESPSSGRKACFTNQLPRLLTAPRLPNQIIRPALKKIIRAATAAPIDFKNIDGARKAEMPEFIKPQLATLTDSAPPGSDWLLEIKFDG